MATRRRVPLNQLWKVKQDDSAKEVLPDDTPIVIIPDVPEPDVNEVVEPEVPVEVPSAPVQAGPSQGVRPSMFWGTAVVSSPVISMKSYSGNWG